MDTKRLAVKFGTGQDVLNAYWGYLSSGGLVIPDGDQLGEGDSVALDIRIDSLEAEYSLQGRVVRVDATQPRAVIAFAPGQPHDMLLTAVLSETDDVPARRERRYVVDLPAAIGAIEGPSPVDGRIVNISASGCCVRLIGNARDALPVGTSDVRVETDRFAVRGTVMWAHNADRGIAFEVPSADDNPIAKLLPDL